MTSVGFYSICWKDARYKRLKKLITICLDAIIKTETIQWQDKYLCAVCPCLISTHTMTPHKFHWSLWTRCIKAIIVRHYLLTFCIGKHLHNNIWYSKQDRIYMRYLCSQLTTASNEKCKAYLISPKSMTVAHTKILSTLPSQCIQTVLWLRIPHLNI